MTIFSPPSEQSILALRTAKDFAKAVGDKEAKSPDDLLTYYMFAQRKAEGYDAVVKISEGDKWGYEVTWYALRGAREDIANTLHNENLRVFCKGPDYFSVDLVLDLNAPIETQIDRTYDPDKKLARPFEAELAVAKEKYGEEQAPSGHVYREQYSRFTMMEEIAAAEQPAVSGP